MLTAGSEICLANFKLTIRPSFALIKSNKILLKIFYWISLIRFESKLIRI